MSEFVNYRKRGITLPKGCKNLFDVLQSHGLPKLASGVQAAAIPADEESVVTRGESVTGKLSDVGEYVAMVFESRARSFMLMVTPPDERITLDVDRMFDGTMEASVAVQTGTEEERAIRAFFAQRGLHLPKDSWMPPIFVPGVPVYITCDISPLPVEAPLLAALLSDLLRVASRLSDDSQLCFRYYEVRDAAQP